MDITPEDLRLVRDYLDLTQAEFADRLNVSQRTIVNWERSGVPEAKTSRVRAALGRTLEEARSEAQANARFQEHWDSITPEELERQYEELKQSDAYQANVADPAPTPSGRSRIRPGMSPAQRRAHLLQAFSDMDLLAELRDRAARRGDKDSIWNAERMERYQRFVAPRWDDVAYADNDEPDYTKMGDASEYGLAASKGDPHIGPDELPHET